MKITNNLGVLNFDNITSSINSDDDDDADSPIVVSQGDGSTGNGSGAGYLISPTPALSSHDVTIPPLPNRIDMVSNDGLDTGILDVVSNIVPYMDKDSISFLHERDADDDASLFAGLLNENDVDIDGSSVVAVDELLSLDRILGFDSTDFDVDNDWL